MKSNILNTKYLPDRLLPLRFLLHFRTGPKRLAPALFLLAQFLTCMLPCTIQANDDWLLIDTTVYTLSLMRGETAVTVFEGIAIGQEGVSRRRVVGDQRTPLGAYRISEVRDSSRYHRFIALDYPSLNDAQEALNAGVIDAEAFQAIRHAHEQGRQPPSNTALGGEIGIHGVGKGDPRIHEDYDWTDGCIALTDEQIDDLVPHLATGMTVVIR